VTDEELETLIAAVDGRIGDVERRLASGDIEAADGQRQLEGLRQELANLQTYRRQLAEYAEAEDDFGDDFGDLDDFVEEFDEALPAIEQDTGGPAAAETEEPRFAAPEPEPEAEPTEEAFEELEDEFIEQEIPEDEFEDLDEEVEDLDDGLDDGLDVGPDEFEDLDEELDEFEELGEGSNGPLLRRLTESAYVNHYRGTVGIATDGRVVWTGDIVLPSLAARY
jgi:DNA repair exonuclease SbcCD ATPase subunit